MIPRGPGGGNVHGEGWEKVFFGRDQKICDSNLAVGKAKRGEVWAPKKHTLHSVFFWELNKERSRPNSELEFSTTPYSCRASPKGVKSRLFVRAMGQLRWGGGW